MLTIENLNKSFGSTDVLHDINLNFSHGEIIGLFGEQPALRATSSLLTLSSPSFHVAARPHIRKNKNLCLSALSPRLITVVFVRLNGCGR